MTTTPPEKSWLDRYATRLVVVLVTLLVLVPAGIIYRYSSTVGKVADQAKTSSQTNRRLVREVKRAGEALHDGLVEGCEKNGNTVREILQERIRKEIETTKSITPDLFPQFPPEKLRELIRKSNAENRKEIDALAPVDCEAQYPGQPAGPSGEPR